MSSFHRKFDSSNSIKNQFTDTQGRESKAACRSAKRSLRTLETLFHVCLDVGLHPMDCSPTFCSPFRFHFIRSLPFFDFLDGELRRLCADSLELRTNLRFTRSIDQSPTLLLSSSATSILLLIITRTIFVGLRSTRTTVVNPGIVVAWCS